MKILISRNSRITEEQVYSPVNCVWPHQTFGAVASNLQRTSISTQGVNNPSQITEKYISFSILS
jgi:hypothetical protein